MWRKYSACRYEHIQPYFLSKFFDKKCSGNFVGQIVIQISNFRYFYVQKYPKSHFNRNGKNQLWHLSLITLINDGNSGDFFFK